VSGELRSYIPPVYQLKYIRVHLLPTCRTYLPSSGDIRKSVGSELSKRVKLERTLISLLAVSRIVKRGIASYRPLLLYSEGLLTNKIIANSSRL
jgi:hypothetical protein